MPVLSLVISIIYMVILYAVIVTEEEEVND